MLYIVQVKYRNENSVSRSLYRFIWGVTMHVSHCLTYTDTEYGQQKEKKKLQHQIKMFFYPQLPDRCLFFARNNEKYCQVDFYTSNTMWKHTLLYSRNNSTRSVQIRNWSVDPANQTRWLDMQVEAYKTDRLVTPFHWRKKRLSSGKCLLNSIYVNLTNIFSKPDEYISIYCWRSSG